MQRSYKLVNTQSKVEPTFRDNPLSNNRVASLHVGSLNIPVILQLRNLIDKLASLFFLASYRDV